MFGQNEAEDRIKEALDSGDLGAVNDLSLGFARRLAREFEANSLCIITAFDANLSLPRCVELLHSLEEFLRGAGVLSLKFVGMWRVPELEANAQFQAGQILPEPGFCCIGITLPVVRMIAEKYHHPALYLGPETNDQVVVVPLDGDSRLIGEFDPAGSQAYGSQTPIVQVPNRKRLLIHPLQEPVCRRPPPTARGVSPRNHHLFRDLVRLVDDIEMHIPHRLVAIAGFPGCQLPR